MCTLTFAWRAFADAPLVVAANRDERLDRTSEPPAVAEGDPAFLAPRDAVAGGTWIGYNEPGVFAGLTNRWVRIEDGGERSRGQLVRDVLRTESADDARPVVESAVESDTYNGFNLVVADGRGRGRDGEPAAYLFEWDGDLRVRQLDPGVHVVVNVGIDGERFDLDRDPERGIEQAHNAERILGALDPTDFDGPVAWRDRAMEVLGDHEYGVCIHEPDRDFGTRSSSVLTFSADGDVGFRFADGPPCETSFERVESQV
ncbi:NRDE family protein [Halobellus sp. EA9]|uniref:NRDE family protein n=1 Tax=Halobellus sp. EA9 TaxID=3421647 RepID=UPI003EBFF3E6